MLDKTKKKFIKAKKIKSLTIKQSDDISILFDEYVRIKDLNIDQIEECFRINDNNTLSDTLLSFFLTEIEPLEWFRYDLHAKLILNDIETFIEFYKDESDFDYVDEEGEEWGDDDDNNNQIL